jgi:alpha-N-arabinofuranosidase
VPKGRHYAFYVYLKARGTGKGFVEFDKLGGPIFGRQEFNQLADEWNKYTAEFTAAEDTSEARIRIGFEGAGRFWIDSASFMPADNLRGVRRDVVEALKPLRMPILRFPGDCFADYYHWKTGIEPREPRPEFWGEAWSEWNENDFRIDEYMDLARELGFQGHITTNYISGTAREAADWAEYANGSAQTPMGRVRAQNGHREPYDIKFWAVGNEAPTLCSEKYTGGTKLSNYAERFREYQAPCSRLILLFASWLPRWASRIGLAIC